MHLCERVGRVRYCLLCGRDWHFGSTFVDWDVVCVEYMYLHYCTCVVGIQCVPVLCTCTYMYTVRTGYMYMCVYVHTLIQSLQNLHGVVLFDFCLRILLSLESFCAVSLTTSFTAFSDDWSAFPEAFPEVSDVMRKCTSPSILCAYSSMVLAFVFHFHVLYMLCASEYPVQRTHAIQCICAPLYIIIDKQIYCTAVVY